MFRLRVSLSGRKASKQFLCGTYAYTSIWRLWLGTEVPVLVLVPGSTRVQVRLWRLVLEQGIRVVCMFRIRGRGPMQGGAGGRTVERPTDHTHGEKGDARIRGNRALVHNKCNTCDEIVTSNN